MISHKVRQPVAHILGISGLFKSSEKSPKDAKKLMGFMRDSALSLDALTRELSKFISNKITKAKNFK
jgi:signal transduction histidine kinase